MLKRLQENSDLKHDALENDLKMIFHVYEKISDVQFLSTTIILNQTHISSE